MVNIIVKRPKNGELAEWSNAAVLKTVRPERVSEVRILHSPHKAQEVERPKVSAKRAT